MSLISQLTGSEESDPSKNKFSLPIAERAALDLNDAGNAARLLAAYGQDMIFVYGKGWGIWDGNRYSFQSGPLKAEEMAARLPKIIQEEIDAIKAREFTDLEIERFRRREAEKKRGGRAFLDDKDAEFAMRSALIVPLTSHKIKCGNVDKQTKALKAAAWQVRVEIEDLDADPWSLVVKNGVVDLRKVRDAEPLWGDEDPTPAELAKWRAPWFGPPDRSPHPTKCAGTEFIPGAICPMWDEFMDLILPVGEIRYCFQRSMGAMLFGENVPQCALLLRGSGGNGKSTLITILGEVLGMFGGYAEPARVELFLHTQNEAPSKPTPEEIDFPGARAILASEPDPTDVFSAKKIKALTGGDIRTARPLNQPQFKYKPTAIPVIQFNRTPRIKNEDEGTRRRMVFIPFDVSLKDLPAEKRKSKLQAETELRAELPGILNWMLDGFRDYQARVDRGLGDPLGIDPPESMQSLKSRLLESADPIGSFVNATTTDDPDGRVRVREFFAAFKAWASESGARVYSDAAVTDIMTEKGYEKGKVRGNIHFKGLTWIDDDTVQSYRNAFIDTPPGSSISGDQR